jgi:hypothetical protein
MDICFILEKSFVLVDHLTGRVDHYWLDYWIIFAGHMALFMWNIQALDD